MYDKVRWALESRKVAITNRHKFSKSSPVVEISKGVKATGIPCLKNFKISIADF